MGRLLINPRWWQRLRHRRGFGVHSPFAFRFITEVLNPPRNYRYYAEETGVSKNDRFLARLKGFFNSNDVGYYGGCFAASERKKMASTRILNSGILVVDLKDGCPEAVLRRLAEGDVVVFALHHSRGRLAPLLAAMKEGMSFRNRSSRAVLVVKPGLPRQDFWVSW